jgi:hypothetical protein
MKLNRPEQKHMRKREEEEKEGEEEKSWHTNQTTNAVTP